MEEKPLAIKPTIDEIKLQNKRWTRIEEIDKEIEEVSRAAKRITYGIRKGLVKELNDYEKADLKELERQQKKLCQEREEIMETLANKAGEGIKAMIVKNGKELTADEAIEEARKETTHTAAYEETKKAIEALNQKERDLKWEIRQRERELEKIRVTKIKLAYILGGGNPNHVIKPEDIEDDRNKNNNSRKSRNNRH